jgi:hypothetical protein
MSKWKKEPDPASTTVTGRIIYKMTKYRAKTELLYCEDEEDAWFISEYTVERKSRKVTHRSIYIAKDIPQVIGFNERQGWVLERVEEALEESARI